MKWPIRWHKNLANVNICISLETAKGGLLRRVALHSGKIWPGVKKIAVVIYGL